jgi:hypothetical protein
MTKHDSYSSWHTGSGGVSLRQTLHPLDHQRQEQRNRDLGRVGTGRSLIELSGHVAPAPSFAAILRQVAFDGRGSGFR